MDPLSIRGCNIQTLKMPGKVIAAVMHKILCETECAENAGWHLACEIFFQAVLHIIHGCQGGTTLEVIATATIHWDDICKIFEQHREFHDLCVIDLHPAMSEKVSPSVKFFETKPNPATVASDPGIPKLLVAPTGSKHSTHIQRKSSAKRQKTKEHKKGGNVRSDSESQLEDVFSLICCVDQTIQQHSCHGSGGVSSTNFIQHTYCAHTCHMCHTHC